MQSALGLIETRGMVGVVEAADAAAKAADVQLAGFERVGGGLVSLRFYGDVASVQAAVQAGVEAARRVSEVIAHRVIPRPHGDLVGLLEESAGAGPEPAAAAAPQRYAGEELRAMSVTQLRQLVRQTPGTALKGRQISHANKETLVAELERIWQGE